MAEFPRKHQYIYPPLELEILRALRVLFLRTDVPAKFSIFSAATFRGKQWETSAMVKIYTRFIGEIFEIDDGFGSKNRDGVHESSSSRVYIDRHGMKLA
jgi:hypothetical protein